MANEFATIAIGGTLRVSLIAEIGRTVPYKPSGKTSKVRPMPRVVNVMIGLRKAFQRARRRACFISSKLFPGGDFSRFFDEVENFFAGHDATKCLGYLILYGRLLRSNRMILTAKNFLSTHGNSITKKHHAQKKSRHRCPPPLDT